MSIALESNSGDAIRRSRFGHRMPFNSIYDSQEPKVPPEGDHRLLEHDSDSCSSSSIGRNSDLSGGSSDGEESTNDEVQSSYKGPFDTMDALEEVLPVKYDYGRGISKFYGGKSKSFTSLVDASSVSSIKDLAKPENPYNRKRKNLLARTNLLDKSHNCPLKNNGGGILKKLANSSRSSNLLGETLSSSGCNNNHDDSNLISTSPSSCLPPLHPHIKGSPGNRSSSPPQRQSPWRSFSLSDLHCVAASTPNITGLAIYGGDEDNKSH